MTYTSHIIAQTTAAAMPVGMMPIVVPIAKVVRVMPVMVMIAPAIGPIRIAPVVGVGIP